jgi:nifR3 family TIM-barrel protein
MDSTDKTNKLQVVGTLPEIPALVIGNIRIATPALLAPMAGYTHFPFRTICRDHHCGMAFTEMVMVEGIVRHMPQTMHYLETAPGERPLGAHIYGANPDAIIRAGEIIEDLGKFDLIDLNCGCPVRKIRRKGAGVSLMKDPDNIYRIVHGLTQSVSLPVTIKTRLGLTEHFINIDEVAHAAQEGGAAALFLHARLASAGHGGPADWTRLAEIKKQLDIPVIGNGGIQQAEDATAMIRQTGVDGVMIARAAIGAPWIFKAIHHLWTHQAFTPPFFEERRQIITEHLDREYMLMQMENRVRKRRRHSTEQAACGKFRAHLVKYIKGTPGIRDLLVQVQQLSTRDEVMALVDEAFARQQAAC